MEAISEHLERWSTELNSDWNHATSDEEQAALVSPMARRLALLCPAMLNISPLFGFEAEHNQLGEALRVRHTWAVLAADELKCCGKITSTLFATGRASTHLDVLAAARSIDSMLTDEISMPLVIDIEVFDIEVPWQDGWITSSISGSQLLIAPINEQESGLEGLGSGNWRLGSALRIRRFRNSTQITVLEAMDRFGGLVKGLGEPGESQQIRFAGNDALITPIEDLPGGWQFELALVVAGGFSYVFDYGCPSDHSDICSNIKSFAAGVTIES